MLLSQEAKKIHKRKLEKILSDLKADIVISMFDNDAAILPKIKDGSKKFLKFIFPASNDCNMGEKEYGK